MTSNFKTNDWQWFLQDIETQLELQMHPDSNEVERYQADQRARGGRSTSQPGLATSSSSTTLPSFFGGGSSSATTNGGGGRSAAQPSPVDSATKDRLLGGRSGVNSSRGASAATGGSGPGNSYGTFFEVRTTGTLNGHDEEEEMPVLPSAAKKSTLSSSKARLPDSHR